MSASPPPFTSHLHVNSLRFHLQPTGRGPEGGVYRACCVGTFIPSTYLARPLNSLRWVELHSSSRPALFFFSFFFLSWKQVQSIRCREGHRSGKMMAPEPLRSAMAIGSAEDTSLALPSDNKLRTGQQRVLDQVHTIKRGKSKQGKSGSPTLSPTSKKKIIYTL